MKRRIKRHFKFFSVKSGCLMFSVLLVCCSMPGTDWRMTKDIYAEETPDKNNTMMDEEWEWRYTDDLCMLLQVEQSGGAWREMDYDDSDWSVGEGSFGAFDGQRNELDGGQKPDYCLRQYLPDGDNVPVYYFRTRFQADQLNWEDTYSAHISFDDAVIVYLNGSPIYLGNTPDGGYPEEGMYGCAKTCSAPVEDYVEVNAETLREGENILAVELHQSYETSSDIFFHMEPFRLRQEQMMDFRNQTLCLGVGESESEMLVTWQGEGEDGYVEVGESSAFPDDIQVYAAEKACSNDWDTVTFRAELTDLEPGTEYSYRVNDKGMSGIYTFSMPEDDDDFSFLVHGDPQIEEDDPEPMECYELLAEAAMDGRDPAFILSLGDQSDSGDDYHLFLRYLSSDLFCEYPLVAIVGNHEEGSEVFSSFFYMPNMDEETEDTSGDMSGDYWFFKNNTLFLCLNSNNSDEEIHEKFLQKAREECEQRFGTPDWVVAAFHHSLFSAGVHAEDDGILKRRERFVPLLEEAGVDVVFMGHDHIYTRTYPMDGVTPVADDSQEVSASEGIVYFTLSSSTGTKLYGLAEEEFDYTALSLQMTRVDVTDTSFDITVYYEDEDGSVKVLDDYRIIK